MATTLDVYQPFDTGAGANVTEDNWRAQMRHTLESGVLRSELNSMAVFGDSSGKQVKVPSGRVWLRGHYGELTNQTTMAVTSNTSGNPRIDRVVVRVDTVGNRIELDVLAGTPAGSPSAPALTQSSSIWELSLAQVAVANGFATITSGNVTDERTYATPMHGEGRIGYAGNTADQTGIGNSDTDLTALTLPSYVGTSRKVKLTGFGLFQQVTSGGTIIFKIKEGSTELARSTWTAATSDFRTITVMRVLAPTQGAHTYKLTGTTSAGTLSMLGTATESFLLVEDIGPA